MRRGNPSASANAQEGTTMDKGITLGSLAIGLAAVIIGTFGAKPGLAQDKEALIKSALSAGPPAVTDTAKIVDMKGNVLREGSGPYTCFPYEGAPTAPMCLDEEWMHWLHAYMEKKKDYKPSKVGLAYMLVGDPPGSGVSNIDPFAEKATADNQWIEEGPHMMVLVPDAALLESISADPSAGVPYVMWKGTPYAHIMMPTAPRAK
jgi:hypothetical protein